MNVLNLLVMMLALGGLLYAGERIATVMSTAFTEVTDAPDGSEEDDSDAEHFHSRAMSLASSRVLFARNVAEREFTRSSHTPADDEANDDASDDADVPARRPEDVDTREQADPNQGASEP